MEEELINANRKFPKFRSTHEGYAIIKEEVEEAADEMESIDSWLEQGWRYIKANQNAIDEIVAMKQHAINLAAESIQVAAMCQKFIDSKLSEVNK